MNELTESTAKQEALTVEQQAQAVQITTNEQYENAAKILQNIKTSKQKFIDFFAPAKKATDAAHKAVVANEKSCTDPCDKAMAIIKGKMLDFSRKIEAERKAAEEQARLAQQAESDKLLAEAATAEEQGDTMQAAVNMAMAEQMSNLAPSVQMVAPKAQGISTRKVTKVQITDDAAVPAYVNGFKVRIVDEKALLTLHKLNPALTIPGVTFYTENTMAVR